MSEYTHVPMTWPPLVREAIVRLQRWPSPWAREELQRHVDLLARHATPEAIAECRRRVTAHPPTDDRHLAWQRAQFLAALDDIDDALRDARAALEATS